GGGAHRRSLRGAHRSHPTDRPSADVGHRPHDARRQSRAFPRRAGREPARRLRLLHPGIRAIAGFPLPLPRARARFLHSQGSIMAAISNISSPASSTRKDTRKAVQSNLSGFYKLSIEERRALLRQLASLDPHALHALSSDHGLDDEQADQMVENALGVLGMPLGLCVNTRVDGRDWLVPMAVEEPSVVAAASHASKLIRAGGGVITVATPPH